MKTLILSMLIGSTVFAGAPNYRTQDNVLYNITIARGANFQACALRICKISRQHGNGTCAVLKEIGVVSADLTSYGVTLVEKTKCAAAIEEVIPVEANPRFGRGN